MQEIFVLVAVLGAVGYVAWIFFLQRYFVKEKSSPIKSKSGCGTGCSSCTVVRRP